MEIGPVTREQLRRLDSLWEQGRHIAITGSTGSGKTLLARQVYQIRINHGGHVVVFVAKLKEDETIAEEYRGWTRWKTWKKKPSPYENRVLLWPDTRRMTMRQALAHQKEVFAEAFDALGQHGVWTVGVDEGLYTSDPKFLNMAQELAMLHALGRSAKLTVVSLAQRPAHLPLIVYSSASHAFIGRTREAVDLKRVAELGGKKGSRQLAPRIAEQGKHDFLWIPIDADLDPEPVNLKR
jgi:energy-coupling factor transporter ATP-binding protein EcfA2